MSPLQFFIEDRRDRIPSLSGGRNLPNVGAVLNVTYGHGGIFALHVDHVEGSVLFHVFPQETGNKASLRCAH